VGKLLQEGNDQNHLGRGKPKGVSSGANFEQKREKGTIGIKKVARRHHRAENPKY